jgi:hypothetical protein
MRTDIHHDDAFGTQPLSAQEAEGTNGGNIFSDAYEGAKMLVETYIIEPLREIVRQATSPDK